MRFKRRPQYRKIALGTSILFCAFLLIHFVDVGFFWSGILFGLGIVHFCNGFLISRKNPGNIKLSVQSNPAMQTKKQVIK